MKTIIKFALILFLVNFFAASILAGVYIATKSRIEAQQRLTEKEALKEVMPESVGERLEPVKKDNSMQYWKVFKGNDDRPIGYVFIAKKYGYSSVIEIMVGMKKDGTITGVRILSQNETPGLGAKIIEVVSNKTLFSALKGIFLKENASRKEKMLPYFTPRQKVQPVKAGMNGVGSGFAQVSPAIKDATVVKPWSFTEQFKNKNVKDIELSKAGIQAITGATISSKAVVDAIKEEGLEILRR